MSVPLLSSLRKYVSEHTCRWRAHGAGIPAVWLQAFFLIVVWLFFPLEREPLRSLRSRKRELYPQVNWDRPSLLDPFRIAVQTAWLLLVKQGHPSGQALVAPVLRALRAGGALLGRAGDIYGRTCLAFVRRFRPLAENEKPEGGAPGMKRSSPLIWLAIVPGLALAALCITQPFNLQGQIIFLSFMFFSMMALVRVKARITLMLLFVISIVVSGRYLWWRCTATLNTGATLDMILSFALLGAEIYAFLVMVLGYFQVCWVFDRKPAKMPEDKALWPTVDIFIPTYNESIDVIKPTVYAALNLDWPAEKLRVYVLDDGSRDSVAAFAAEAGAGYIKREEHKHAKAGNINHAMTVTQGEYIVIFDCDHVPSREFLTSTTGWMIRDSNIALVQTPHHFYSPDPFEKNMHLDKAMPIENSLFHDFIQKGNDTWNATMFCGSSAVIRRRALEQIGGIAVETVTEDAHTSLKLNRLGWSSAFIDKPLASGLSTETLSAHIGQRIRWARGMIQILRLDCPLLGRGLTLPQRLCFFNAMLHFLHGLPRIIFLLAPLPYMFADIYIIYATAASIFAYVIPHMVHSAVTNQRLQKGYRYPFLSGVYETILSWYILVPTTVALFAPHVGTFNVTAKGCTIDKKYLDWDIAKPYLVLLALNFAGLCIGIWKAFASPDPEYLTLVINIGWIAYNLMIIGAAMAVAVEEVQTHRFPRIDLKIPATLTDAAGNTVAAQLAQYSQADVRVTFDADPGFAAGDTLTLTIGDGRRDYSFTVRAAEGGGAARDFSLCLKGVEDERAFNRCTFSREGMWAIRPEGEVDERFLTGFMKLAEISLYGFRSMIEFLPGRVLPAVRDALVSLLPRTPGSSSH